MIPHSFQPWFFSKTGSVTLGFRRLSRKKDPWKKEGSLGSEWLEGSTRYTHDFLPCPSLTRSKPSLSETVLMRNFRSFDRKKNLIQRRGTHPIRTMWYTGFIPVFIGCHPSQLVREYMKSWVYLTHLQILRMNLLQGNLETKSQHL